MRIGKGAANLLFAGISASWMAYGAFAPQQTSKDANVPKVVFSRDVLPILSENCFKCHGPDAEGRMANMRLDVPEGAYANRNGKYPVVPGDPARSLVVQRINRADSPMPPRFSGKRLTRQEKETLTRWIAQGARYGKIWSFEPVAKTVPIPKLQSSWPRNDIDRFILARLRKQGLSPSRPAPKVRWLRRVTLDLTGLPPTESEIAGFEKDARPDAYERVVDRLLASPHFGERLAVPWLDAARYSDSYGYQSDLLSPTWPYRDWVINAFNRNLPYDQFLTDQLAGDLLPNATTDTILATAFNRLHRQSNEGGSIALEFKTAYAADRVDTFGSAMLGLTVGCARCHDHKFDPITQKEYYQLFGYFNSINEYGLLLSTEVVPTPSVLLPTLQQSKRLNELQLKSGFTHMWASQAQKEAEPAFQAWLAKHPVDPEIPDHALHLSLKALDSGKYVNELGGKSFGEPIGKLDAVDGPHGTAVQFDGDNGLAVRGLPSQERWDAFTWSFWIRDPGTAKGPVVLLHRTGGTDVGFCGFDLMLEDGCLTARVMRHWPGNAVAIRTPDRIPKGVWTHVAWSWDGSGHAIGLRLYIDANPCRLTVLNDDLWKKIHAYGDLGGGGGDWTFAERFRDAGFKGGTIAGIDYADRPLSELEIAQLRDGSSLADALRTPDSSREALREYFVDAFDRPSRDAQQAMRADQRELASFEDGIFEVSVMREAPKLEPSYLLARGNYDAPRNDKTLVHRDTPKSLPPLTAKGANDRLALARWVTRSDNPLTARVAVNRLWEIVFGVGIVETSENFGVQGSEPSHAELLDYLARRFMDSGWNVKAIVREMVLSATYRQDSARTAKLNKLDPNNRLLARGPSERLSAEMVRDTALAAAGLINLKLGGPPVNPYQPAGIWTENNTMSPEFVQSRGVDLYRRSIYSTWKRTTPIPSMMIFDATSRESCTIRRPVTDTPLQALVLLNDVQFVEAARVLAEEALRKRGGETERIRTAFVRLAGREPDAKELAILNRTLNEQRTQFEADPNGAKDLISLGESKPDPKLPPAELAAMTVTVQTALNSDAVIWKR